MHKKAQNFSRIQKHLISILLSVLCMTAAAGFSSVCSHISNRFSLSCILVFVLFIILASCSTADRLYGILCSTLAALWLYLRCISPCSGLQSVSTDCQWDILYALSIMTALSLRIFRLTGQASMAAAAKQQLAEAETEKMRVNLPENLFEGTGYTASVSDAKKGMGVGLVICKTIITAHHGTITGRNHSDCAQFVFALP